MKRRRTSSYYYGEKRQGRVDPMRERLKAKVVALHAASRGTAGSRTLSAALRAEGEAIGRYKARHLMREAGIVSLRIPLKMTADSEERDRLAHRFLTGAGFLLRAVTIGQLGGQFAHRFPAQFEAVRTVQQSVEDGVRQGRLADVVVPVLGG